MSGAELITAERQRQIDAEGWTPEHDDEHTNGEMAVAAIAYAIAAVGYPIEADGTTLCSGHAWPWDEWWYKPSDDPIRNLVKAGALIAAEIDRVQRARDWVTYP